MSATASSAVVQKPVRPHRTSSPGTTRGGPGSGVVLPEADAAPSPLHYRGDVDLRRSTRTSPGPFLVDLALAAVLSGTSLAIHLGSDTSEFTLDAPRLDSPLDWLVISGAAWAVPFRRVAPLAALAAGTLLQMMVWTAGYADSFMAAAILLYSAAAHGPARHRIWVWVSALVMTAYTGMGVAASGVPFYVLPLVGLFGAAAVAFGASIASRQAYTEATEARALELERSRRADRERALAEERSRIARELHDVVAHGLSVMVVQAAAARRILDRDTEGAANALEQIEQTGRQALGEMRHVLSAIRTEPEDSWQPTRGLADLDVLVTELAKTGLPVTVTTSEDATGDTTGDTTGDETGIGWQPVPATVDVTAYRIVQESLTNVLKHGGGGAEARVEIVRRPNRIELTIIDDGRGARAENGGGHGLRGMQERVEVFGGTFRAGPRLGGGFTVEATLPWDADHTAPASR